MPDWFAHFALALCMLKKQSMTNSAKKKKKADAAVCFNTLLHSYVPISVKLVSTLFYTPVTWLG